MTDGISNRHSHNTRIDERILKHLLGEAVDMLEESQTHALVERSSPTTTHVLSQATWRLTTTCAWIFSELNPSGGDAAARLKAPAPIFARETEPLSAQLEVFEARVLRLHQRACKLEELSRGPMISTEVSAQSIPANAEARRSADIIQMFGATGAEKEQDNPVHKSQLRLSWALSQR